MSFIPQNILRNLNPPNKYIPKENNHHSQSPKMRPIYNPQKQIKNNLFQKSRINNYHNINNINIINGNI